MNEAVPKPKLDFARRKGGKRSMSLYAEGEPMVWLTGGALGFSLLMILSMLGFVFWMGFSNFWPKAVYQVTTHLGEVHLGPVTRAQSYQVPQAVINALPDGLRTDVPAELAATGELSPETAEALPEELREMVVEEFLLSGSLGEETLQALPVELRETVREELRSMGELSPETAAALPEELSAGALAAEFRNSRKLSDETIKLLPGGLRSKVQEELLKNEGLSKRILLYTGNYDLTGTRFQWVNDFEIAEQTAPEWAFVMERRMDGNFYGFPVAFMIDGERVAEDPARIWELFQEHHSGVSRRFRQRERLRTVDMGRINRQQEAARLALVEARRRHDRGAITAEELAAVRRQSEEAIELARTQHAEVTARVEELNTANRRFAMVMRTAQDVEATMTLDRIVLAYPSNQVSTAKKAGIFLGRWREFLLDDPREANMEGGVFPAIVGTVTMTLVMTLFVVPFGVLAALYLREYAKPGPVVSAVRIAINNLAGVPSIVFGVFGLGFFCYIMGGHLDELFYAARLPAPTFRKGGVLWAASTLALLTLPVVIVATEEALSAVPGSMREGSYACGASKWQTIKRIVLPRAMPGIMTGMILAMARGAGEVAPLMLVGAVKLAPSLPFDIHNWSGSLGPIPTGPIHLERSFLHLGFHIYDLGFQSSDSEAARPMVYTTTLLLITIIVLLNLSAMIIRTKLRRKFSTGAF